MGKNSGRYPLIRRNFSPSRQLPCSLMNSHEISCAFVYSRQFSGSLFNSRAHLSTLIALVNSHSLSSTFVCFYQLSSALINFHALFSTLERFQIQNRLKLPRVSFDQQVFTASLSFGLVTFVRCVRISCPSYKLCYPEYTIVFRHVYEKP